MARRWVIGLGVLALVASGCATLTEVSAPVGDNSAGLGFEGFTPSAPTISGDGRYTVFAGRRSVADSTTEAYRHDALTNATVRVSSDATGAAVGGESPAISRDGRYVAFITRATLVAGDTNLDPSKGWTGTDVYVRDMQTGALSLVTLETNGGPFVTGGLDSLVGTIFMSANGRYVAYSRQSSQGRTFSASFYVRDRQAANPVAVGGGYGVVAGMSGDGYHLAVDDYTACTSLCPVYNGGRVLHWVAGTETAIGCEASGAMPLSDDGRYLATMQTAKNGCAPGLVRYDLATDDPVVPFPAVVPLTAPVLAMSMSADGARVAFASALAILPEDTNGVDDVYVGDFVSRVVGIASRTALNGPGDGRSIGPGLSADGRYVVFDTLATNLIGGDGDGANDIVETPALRPVAAGAIPSSVARGGTNVAVTIGGSAFAADAVVSVSGSGVTIGATTVPNGVTVVTHVSVAANATPGPRDVLVTNPGPYGSATGWCFGCLTVT